MLASPSPSPPRGTAHGHTPNPRGSQIANKNLNYTNSGGPSPNASFSAPPTTNKNTNNAANKATTTTQKPTSSSALTVAPQHERDLPTGGQSPAWQSLAGVTQFTSTIALDGSLSGSNPNIIGGGSSGSASDVMGTVGVGKPRPPMNPPAAASPRGGREVSNAKQHAVVGSSNHASAGPSTLTSPLGPSATHSASDGDGDDGSDNDSVGSFSVAGETPGLPTLQIQSPTNVDLIGDAVRMKRVADNRIVNSMQRSGSEDSLLSDFSVTPGPGATPTPQVRALIPPQQQGGASSTSKPSAAVPMLTTTSPGGKQGAQLTVNPSSTLGVPTKAGGGTSRGPSRGVSRGRNVSRQANLSTNHLSVGGPNGGGTASKKKGSNQWNDLRSVSRIGVEEAFADLTPMVVSLLERPLSVQQAPLEQADSDGDKSNLPLDRSDGEDEYVRYGNTVARVGDINRFEREWMELEIQLDDWMNRGGYTPRFSALMPHMNGGGGRMSPRMAAIALSRGVSPHPGGGFGAKELPPSSDFSGGLPMNSDFGGFGLKSGGGVATSEFRNTYKKELANAMRGSPSAGDLQLSPHQRQLMAGSSHKHSSSGKKSGHPNGKQTASVSGALESPTSRSLQPPNASRRRHSDAMTDCGGDNNDGSTPMGMRPPMMRRETQVGGFGAPPMDALDQSSDGSVVGTDGARTKTAPGVERATTKRKESVVEMNGTHSGVARVDGKRKAKGEDGADGNSGDLPRRKSELNGTISGVKRAEKGGNNRYHPPKAATAGEGTVAGVVRITPAFPPSTVESGETSRASLNTSNENDEAHPHHQHRHRHPSFEFDAGMSASVGSGGEENGSPASAGRRRRSLRRRQSSVLRGSGLNGDEFYDGPEDGDDGEYDDDDGSGGCSGDDHANDSDLSEEDEADKDIDFDSPENINNPIMQQKKQRRIKRQEQLQKRAERRERKARRKAALDCYNSVKSAPQLPKIDANGYPVIDGDYDPHNTFTLWLGRKMTIAERDNWQGMEDGRVERLKKIVAVYMNYAQHQRAPLQRRGTLDKLDTSTVNFSALGDGKSPSPARGSIAGPSSPRGSSVSASPRQGSIPQSPKGTFGSSPRFGAPRARPSVHLPPMQASPRSGRPSSTN